LLAAVCICTMSLAWMIQRLLSPCPHGQHQPMLCLLRCSTSPLVRHETQLWWLSMRCCQLPNIACLLAATTPHSGAFLCSMARLYALLLCSNSTMQLFVTKWASLLMQYHHTARPINSRGEGVHHPPLVGLPLAHRSLRNYYWVVCIIFM